MCIDRMNKQIEQKIQSFLPFKSCNEVWRRIEVLEAENSQIVKIMLELAEYFRQVLSEPREIYLSVQEVRSLTVYIRWRKKGVRGNQTYLVLNSIEGKDFLLRQSLDLQTLYLRFNKSALELNLAHSLRLNGIRRLRQYLRDVQ